MLRKIKDIANRVLYFFFKKWIIARAKAKNDADVERAAVEVMAMSRRDRRLVKKRYGLKNMPPSMNIPFRKENGYE